MDSQKRTYYFLLHLTILIFGLTGVLGKLISVSADVLVWYRLLIGVAGIVVYFFITKTAFKVNKKDLINLAAVGLIIAAHWVTFFEAIKQSNVSVALTCMASSTFFTAILEPLYFRRRIKLYEIGLGLVVLFAISLIFSIDFSYKLGIILSVTSAFLASWFTVLNGKLIKRVSAKLITFYQLASALFFVSVYLLAQSKSMADMALANSDIVYLLILGLACTSFAFLVSVEVMKKISPFTVSMSVNLEPIYSIAVALLIWPETEKMPSLFYYAFILILAAIFVNAYWKNKMDKAGKEKG